MNFFEHQARSRQKTLYLLALFILGVAGIVLAVYVAIQGFLITQDTHHQKVGSSGWFDPNLFLMVSGSVLSVILGGGGIKGLALLRGGDYVASSLGGRPVYLDTTDAGEKRFLNVVEEMALASGVPVPGAFVLDSEKGVNAFAAGYNPNTAVVAVTRGCLDHLNRDELQGVVAHEFSHILNGDMRLNIRLIAMISGILTLASIGRILLRSLRNAGRNRKNSGPVAAVWGLGLLLFIVGYLGVLAARIIQSAVSRQREFLADASAVQFTRNPSGIAGALRKIGQITEGSRVTAPLAEEASHLFFSTAVSGFFTRLFATHPPLAERIKRLEPAMAAAVLPEPPAGATRMGPQGLRQSPDFLWLAPDEVTAGVGVLSPGHLQQGADLLKALPPPFRKELGDPLGASALVLALLISQDPHERALQKAAVKNILTDAQLSLALALAASMVGMDAKWRLPLADLAMPMLRRMSDDQQNVFKTALKALCEADGQMKFFEFVLGVMVNLRLGEFKGMIPIHRRFLFKSIEAVKEDVKILAAKAALAGAGGDEGLARRAFAAALRQIPGRHEPTDAPLLDPPPARVEAALRRLAEATPGIKKTVLDAIAYGVLFDRQVSLDEAELVRVVAYCLALPLPPFLQTV